ncbi:hypothetical protein JOQ06_000730, partial [Pogonophryne albipinna]
RSYLDRIVSLSEIVFRPYCLSLRDRIVSLSETMNCQGPGLTEGFQMNCQGPGLTEGFQINCQGP